MAVVSVATDGTLIIDGKVVTPAEAGSLIQTTEKDLKAVYDEVRNRKNWNIKGAERAIVYVATLITTTNVFGQIPVPNGVKEWLLGGAAFILGAIHLSTPTK